MDLQAKKEQMDALVEQLQQLREMQLGKGTVWLKNIIGKLWKPSSIIYEVRHRVSISRECLCTAWLYYNPERMDRRTDFVLYSVVLCCVVLCWMSCFVLYCVECLVLCCTVLNVLFCVVLYWMSCFVLCCTVLNVLCCFVLCCVECLVLFCIVLCCVECVVLCCVVLC